jgi:hypothetical protein
MVDRDKQKPQRWLSNGNARAQLKPLTPILHAVAAAEG